MIVLQFSRTVAPETGKGPALLLLLQHYKWKKVVVLMSAQTPWLESGLGQTNQLQAAGVEVFALTVFGDGFLESEKGAALSPLRPAVLANLHEIKRSGIRIIFLLAYDVDIVAVASSAVVEGMTNETAWILMNAPVDGVTEQMQGWLYLRPLLPSEGIQDFAKQVSDYTKKYFNITTSPDSVDLAYSAALHDAILLYAHGATKVMSEGGDLRDGEAVTKAVRNTSFTGVGGSVVALDSRGDRIESYMR